MTEDKVISNEDVCSRDSCSCISDEQCLSSNDSTTTGTTCVHKPFTCGCYSHHEATKLTHNKVLALMWALTSVLKYDPSDPVYYMSYQLLHWKYNNAPQKSVKNVVDYINKQL